MTEKRQSVAKVAKVLGIPKASLGNWVRLEGEGQLAVLQELARSPRSRESRWRSAGCAQRVHVF